MLKISMTFNPVLQISLSEFLHFACKRLAALNFTFRADPGCIGFTQLSPPPQNVADPCCRTPFSYISKWILVVAQQIFRKAIYKLWKSLKYIGVSFKTRIHCVNTLVFPVVYNLHLWILKLAEICRTKLNPFELCRWQSTESSMDCKNNKYISCKKDQLQFFFFLKQRQCN